MKDYNEEDLKVSQEDWDMMIKHFSSPEVIPELRQLLNSESVFEN